MSLKDKLNKVGDIPVNNKKTAKEKREEIITDSLPILQKKEVKVDLSHCVMGRVGTPAGERWSAKIISMRRVIMDDKTGRDALLVTFDNGYVCNLAIVKIEDEVV